MTKKTPALLATGQPTEEPYRITLKLQQGRTATFSYSDRAMARDHWDTLRALGVIGGHAIKDSQFHDAK